MTLGDNTKNPPLILPPSPLGFSLNEKSLFASAMTCAPNRPSGLAFQCRQLFMRLLVFEMLMDIYIADPVAVGKAEKIFH